MRYSRWYTFTYLLPRKSGGTETLCRYFCRISFLYRVRNVKRRIEQLLNGIFEYEPEKLVLLPEELTINAKPGEVVHGSFHIERKDGKKVRGFLYSSSPRMTCSPVEFQGIVNEIHYQVDCSGYEDGAADQGTITVCSELGEYTLPFSICARQRKPEKEELPFSDSAQFVQLARSDFQKAYRYFLTKEFREMLEKESEQLLALYDGLGASDFSYQSMEEFLSASGLKDALVFSLEKEELSWKNLTEPVRETIVVSKNTWGFQKIAIYSDAKFLRPEKKEITTDEFAGSSFDLNLVIDTNLMHAGNNYARLWLETPHQKLELSVTAKKADSRAAARANHICKIMMKKMEALYVSFRLKKIDLPTWIERSVSVLGSYRRAGGDDPFADLFLVQLYFADGKKQKAYKVLETLEAQKDRLNTPERYGFYLYMTTFFYQEASYVDRVEAEINKMFCRDKTNWKLQWILLYLQEDYLKDENLKYEAVAEQFRFGCRSRIMYLEAYLILKKDPFRMRRLELFELQLLRFAAKEEVLTAEIVRQTANLASHHGEFSNTLYEVLTEGYRLYPSPDIVKAICYLLMKGGRKDRRYFEWYEKGVEAGLRVTGLYEYYMETMDESDIRKVPQIIRMYFAYDTTLDYRKRAAIYRRMVENREQDIQTYQHYRAAMEKFTMDQLESGRISDDLAVLYRAFLRENALTKQSAVRLARLLFTYEVTCSQPGMCQVIVRSPHMRSEQAKALTDGRALIRIYDPDSVVLLADAQGNRYAADALCQVRRIFKSEEMLEWCAKKAPDYPGVVLYLCSQCLAAGLANRNTLPYFITACEMEELTGRFRSCLRARVLHYYLEHPREESLREFLEQIPLMEYVKVDKTALITLLAEEGMCQDAFALLDGFGAEGIPLMQLVRICSRMVLELEFEENTMLLALCYSCFASGKYDDKLLRYLLLYYEGPVREMKRVWQAARKFELDTMLLEEKIMMMLLFTRSETQGSEPIFESYLDKMGRKKLCRAYVNLKAYEYFVKDIPVADCVFRYMEKEYQYLKNQNRAAEQEEVCRLALLQYYAKAVELNEAQKKCVEEMLEEFGAKGMRFAFWKRFDKSFLRPYQMEGKVFAEYVCNPAHSVTIYYRLRGSGSEYRKESVENCFDGIFVKEFTLFAKEELECYLEEDDGTETKKTDLWILRSDDRAADETTKFGMLNRICEAAAKGDEGAVWEGIESWMTLEHLVEEVFTLV